MRQLIPYTDFTAGEIGPKFHGRWDTNLFQRASEWLENWIVFSQGGMTTRPPLKYLGAINDTGEKGRLIPFAVSDDDYFEVELTEHKLRVWKGDTLVSITGGDITTTYDTEELPYIQYQRVRNELYLVQRNHPIAVLVWSGGTVFTFGNLSISCGTGIPAWQAGHDYEVGEVCTNGTPKKIYKCITAGTSAGAGGPTTEADDITDNTVHWTWEYTQPFSQTGDYPGAIAYYNQRMWFAGTDNEPDAVWASLPWDFGCFDFFYLYQYESLQLKPAASWSDPLVPETETVVYTQTVIGDASAIVMYLASDQDETIYWLAASDSLVIGTATSEWIVPVEVTALNLVARIRSRLGSADMQARVVNENPMFIQGSRDRSYLREYEYTSESAQLVSPDLSFMNDSILEDGVDEWDFTQVPQPMWVGVVDGELRILLYSKVYKTTAWMRVVTGFGGEIESACVVPGNEGDQIYVIVNRLGERYLERFEQIWDDTKTPLDSYKYVNGAGASVTGLARFEGQEVTIYNQTHDSYRTGTVTAGVLDTTADTGDDIWIGIPIVSQSKLMRVQTMTAQGTIGQTLIKKVHALNARVLESRQFKCGTDLDHLEFAERLDDQEWTSEYTGDARVALDSDWDRGGSIWLYNDRPYKVTILAILAEVDA